MVKKSMGNDRGPGYSKTATVITIIVMVGAVFMTVTGFGLFGEFNIWRIAIGAAVVVICVGFLFHARWAQFLAGIALMGAGLFLSGAILYKIISAGPFTLPGYQDPFEDMPPLMAAFMVLAGLGIAMLGLVMVSMVFEKKKPKSTSSQPLGEAVLPASHLRVDGIYKAREEYPSNFRFFPDGRVTSVVSSFSPAEVYLSLEANASGILSGTYSLSSDGKSIAFTLFNPIQNIASFIYSGTLEKAGMQLEKTHIVTGASEFSRSMLILDFIPVEPGSPNK